MAAPGNRDLRLGSDPEEAHLPETSRMLQEVKWHRLSTVQNDFMVTRVLQF